jgi:LysM repeat protein
MDEIRDEDIEIDVLALGERPGFETKEKAKADSPARKSKHFNFFKPKTIIIGGIILSFIAVLSYVFLENIENYLRSKNDATIIQYQLGQIDEKIKKDTIETEKSVGALTQQVDKLSQRIDALEDKINSLKTEDSGKLFVQQTDQIAARMDSIEDKINALSNNVSTLTSIRYHKVRNGENLTEIAQKYDLTLTELCDLNQISPKNQIHPGQKLRVSSPFMQ